MTDQSTEARRSKWLRYPAVFCDWHHKLTWETDGEGFY